MHSQALTPLHSITAMATSAAKALCDFLYGDERRTRRSVTFAYLCVSLYLLAAVNAGSVGACAS